MKSNNSYRFITLLVAVITLCLVLGCDDSSDGNKLTIGDVAGDYYHFDGDDWYKASFNSGVCNYSWKPAGSSEKFLGSSNFSINSLGDIILDEPIGNIRSFRVFDSGDFIKSNTDLRYDKG